MRFSVNRHNIWSADHSSALAPELAHIDDSSVTPHQRAKQQLIVEVAKEVLVNKGLTAIAEARSLTKGVVHYYLHRDNAVVRILDGRQHPTKPPTQRAASRACNR